MDNYRYVEHIEFEKNLPDEELKELFDLCHSMHNKFNKIEVHKIDRTTFEYREPAVNVESLLWATSELCEYQEFMESLEKWEWEDKDPNFKKADLILGFKEFFVRNGKSYGKSTTSN